MRAAPGIIFGKKASLSVRKQQTRIYRFLRRTSGRYSDMYLGSDTQLNFPLASCRTIILALQYIRTQEVGETWGNTGKYGEISFFLFLRPGAFFGKIRKNMGKLRTPIAASCLWPLLLYHVSVTFFALSRLTVHSSS